MPPIPRLRDLWRRFVLPALGISHHGHIARIVIGQGLFPVFLYSPPLQNFSDLLRLSRDLLRDLRKRRSSYLKGLVFPVPAELENRRFAADSSASFLESRD